MICLFVQAVHSFAILFGTLFSPEMRKWTDRDLAIFFFNYLVAHFLFLVPCSPAQCYKMLLVFARVPIFFLSSHPAPIQLISLSLQLDVSDLCLGSFLSGFTYLLSCFFSTSPRHKPLHCSVHWTGHEKRNMNLAPPALSLNQLFSMTDYVLLSAFSIKTNSTHCRYDILSLSLSLSLSPSLPPSLSAYLFVPVCCTLSRVSSS
jgi:hypothetical protein